MKKRKIPLRKSVVSGEMIPKKEMQDAGSRSVHRYRTRGSAISLG